MSEALEKPLMYLVSETLHNVSLIIKRGLKNKIQILT